MVTLLMQLLPVILNHFLFLKYLRSEQSVYLNPDVGSQQAQLNWLAAAARRLLASVLIRSKQPELNPRAP